MIGDNHRGAADAPRCHAARLPDPDGPRDPAPGAGGRQGLRLKALVVVPRLPGTGFTGDRVRTGLHLSALGRLGAEVTLVGGLPSGQEAQPVPGAARTVGVPLSSVAIVPGLVRSALRGEPLQTALLAGPWEAALAALPGGFDLVVVLLVRLWPLVARALPGRVPVVLDHIDALAAAAGQAARLDPSPLRRLYWRIEAPRLSRAERLAAPRAALSLATTPFDAGALPAGTVPLALGATLRPFSRTPRPLRVVFTGRLGYRPNAVAATELVSEVWPLVRARVPAAELVLAGADAPRALLARARRAGVRVESPVPDVPELLRQALVVAAPVRLGTGTPMKLWEALEAGAAVVCTSAVADRGAVDGQRPPVRVADTPAALAGAITSYLLDPASAEADGDRGRAFVERYARRDDLVEQLVPLLRSAAGGR